MTRNSLLYSFTKESFVAPSDLRLSQGWPIAGCPHFGFVRSPFLQSLPFRDHVRLLGNGMVLPHVGAVALYILSHVIRREELERLAPSVNMRPAGCENEDDADTGGAKVPPST